MPYGYQNQIIGHVNYVTVFRMDQTLPVTGYCASSIRNLPKIWKKMRIKLYGMKKVGINHQSKMNNERSSIMNDIYLNCLQ